MNIPPERVASEGPCNDPRVDCSALAFLSNAISSFALVVGDNQPNSTLS
jgi:hypothetical protein